MTLSRAGDEVEILLAGGAGFGDPHARGFDAIDRDLAEGYVTAEGAMRAYDVVVVDGRVDRAASQRLRAGQREAAQ